MLFYYTIIGSINFRLLQGVWLASISNLEHYGVALHGMKVIHKWMYLTFLKVITKIQEHPVVAGG